MHKKYSLLLGRFQLPQPHRGHFSLIDTLLSEGKNVVIALRKEDGTKANPYSQAQRTVAFEGFYRKEIEEGRIVIINVPDIIEVAHGRTPGWKIREVKVPSFISSISGTGIRENGGFRVLWLTGNSGAEDHDSKRAPGSFERCEPGRKRDESFYIPGRRLLTYG